MKDLLKFLVILNLLLKTTITIFGSSEEDFEEEMDESLNHHIC